MLDCELFGLDAGAHHMVSVGIHAANAVLLLLVLKRMTGGLWPSAFVAGVFALHPLRVESVAWAAERKDVLSGMFWMLTLWAYARYTERPGISRYAWALTLFALGLMAKPMLVTLPFVLLLLDCWPLKRFLGLPPWRLLREKLPFVGLALLSSVITLVAQRGAIADMTALPAATRIANALVSYLAYIGKTLWPVGLAVIYRYPEHLPAWKVAGATVGLVGITAAVIWKARRYPYLPVGWLWYVGTLVPVIGLVQVGQQPMADRYTYLPLIGLYVIVVWGVPEWLGPWSLSRKAATGAGVAVIVACALATWEHMPVWKSSITLYEHALAIGVRSPVIHNNLGNALADLGRLTEAMGHYREALRLWPNYPEAHNNLGMVLTSVGKFSEAIEECREALRLRPDLAEAHGNLGKALAGRGEIAEAIVHYKEFVRLLPDDPEGHLCLGALLSRAGRVAEAVTEYREATRLNPAYADAHNNLGNELARLGRLAEAVWHYRQALRLKPDDAETRYNLANSLVSQGRLAEAVAEYQETVRLRADFAEAHNNLGAALQALGRTNEAAAHLEAARRLAIGK
jgi:Flp pilus assembly protein TadD